MLLLVSSMLLSNKLYLLVIKDIINAIILISFYIILYFIVCNKNELYIFTDRLIRIILFFAVIVSLERLSISLNISPFNNYLIPEFSTDEVVGIDYNFALIPVLLGIVIIFYLLKKKVSIKNLVVLNVVFIIFILNVFFSGSRRGFFIGFLIVILLVSIQVILLFIRDIKIKMDYRNLKYPLISLVMLFIISLALIFLTSYKIKNKALEFLGTNDISISKSQITSNIFRYVSVFDKKAIYADLYRVIWSTNFNPKDPDSGWASRIHKKVFPLTGKNSEIVPLGSIGYQMDSTCNSESWAGNAYSFTVVGNNKVSAGDTLRASVFCFVSNEFNGTWVILLSEGATLGNTKFEYDLKNKVTWQKLSINVVCGNGDSPVYLYFSKYGTTNLSSLKGYVIFAYPQVDIVRRTDETLGNSQYNDLSIRIGKSKKLGFGNKSPLSYSGSVAVLNMARLMQPIIEANINIDHLNRPVEKDFVDFSNLFKNIHFTNQLTMLSFSNLSHSKVYDRDLIRNWIAKIISEDTVYYGYKSVIQTDKLSSVFYDERLIRWQFAWQIFNKEFNWKQKIFGGGFNFLNWYGFYFLKDKTLSDYPHNPFLSILLYSGIVGLILYLFLLYKVFYYYLKYLKEYYLFFIFFLITFFFSFFSGSSPFDPPIMGFFILLPFFFHSFHKNDNYTKTEKLTNDEDSDHRY
jgi:hypothetical protein